MKSEKEEIGFGDSGVVCLLGEILWYSEDFLVPVPPVCLLPRCPPSGILSDLGPFFI